jgi:hypothetical protein
MSSVSVRVNRQPLTAGRPGWGRIAAFGAGLVVACLALGAAVTLAIPDNPNSKGALVGAYIVCAFAALAPILFLGRGAAREPIFYYPVIAFPDLAGSALAWLGEPDTNISLARADVTKALLLVAAGFAALWVGWFASRGKRTRSPRTHLTSRELPSRGLTLALAAVGCLSLAVLVATGSFGYVRSFDTGGPLGRWTEWVVAARTTLDVALAFAAFRAFGTSARLRARPDLGLLGILLGLEFGTGLLHGSKVTYILPRLLIVIFIYAVFQDRIPVKWIFGFVIATALAVPVVDHVRSLSSEPGGTRNAAQLVVLGVRNTVENPYSSATAAVDVVNRRARQIENVAVVLRDTPSVFPHTNGQSIPEAIAIASVPRILWPNKPVFDTGRAFPQLYLKQAPTSRSATGPSHFGDLYRNFGLAGVILGMGVLGSVFAVLGRLTGRGGVRVLFIIAFTLTVLTRDEDSLAEGIVAFTHIMAPVFLAAFLLPRSHFTRSSIES